ncbi:MAG TPA: hypothetical protein VGJ20_30975 [Xanthobacteraceae bacterium]|jgi:hypothetical protein
MIRGKTICLILFASLTSTSALAAANQTVTPLEQSPDEAWQEVIDTLTAMPGSKVKRPPCPPDVTTCEEYLSAPEDDGQVVIAHVRSKNGQAVLREVCSDQGNTIECRDWDMGASRIGHRKSGKWRFHSEPAIDHKHDEDWNKQFAYGIKIEKKFCFPNNECVSYMLADHVEQDGSLIVLRVVNDGNEVMMKRESCLLDDGGHGNKQLTMDNAVSRTCTDMDSHFSRIDIHDLNTGLWKLGIELAPLSIRNKAMTKSGGLVLPRRASPLQTAKSFFFFIESNLSAAARHLLGL